MQKNQAYILMLHGLSHSKHDHHTACAEGVVRSYQEQGAPDASKKGDRESFRALCCRKMILPRLAEHPGVSSRVTLLHGRGSSDK